MEIKLANKYAETIKDAYKLTSVEMLTLKIRFLNVDNSNINNTYEHVIPILDTIDYNTVLSAIYIIRTLEEVDIRSVVDLVEFICSIEKTRGVKYLKMILLLLDYRDSLMKKE